MLVIILTCGYLVVGAIYALILMNVFGKDDAEESELKEALRESEPSLVFIKIVLTWPSLLFLYLRIFIQVFSKIIITHIKRRK